jgi:hypothetical protein
MAYGGTKAGTSGKYSQSGMQGSGKTNRINGGRGIRVCGYQGTAATFDDVLDFWTMQVTGNAVDFGNSLAGGDHHACSDGIRFVAMSGSGPGFSGGTTNGNDMDYGNFTTPANAFDFGNINTARRHACVISGGARGIVSAGFASPLLTASQEYITVATTGNAVSYGNRTEALYDLGSGSDGSRGVVFGGETPESVTIDYVSIYQLGDAIDFGDMFLEGRMNSGTQHGSRGYRSGGDVNDTQYDGIEMFEIGTFANAIDYGELTQARYYAAGTSDGIRNVIVSGTDAGLNTMDYYNSFALTNALDFVNLTTPPGRCGATAGS